MATTTRGLAAGNAVTDLAIGGHRLRAAKPKPTKLSFESLEHRTVLSASASALAAIRLACEVRDSVPLQRNCSDTQTPSASSAYEGRSANNTRQSCDPIPVCEAKQTYDSKRRCETTPMAEVKQQRCETPTYETKQRCEPKSTVDTKQRCETKPTSEVKQQRCETTPTCEVKQQRCESTPTYDAKQRCETKGNTDAKQRCETKTASDSKQRCETKSTADTKQQRCETKPVCEVKRCSDAEPARTNGAKVANRNCETQTRETRQCVESAKQVAAKVVDGCFGDLRFVSEVTRRR